MDKLTHAVSLKTRIRYLHTEADSLISPIGDDSVFVKFSEPQSAVTCGQFAVFYDNDIVIGAGVIDSVVK